MARCKEPVAWLVAVVLAACGACGDGSAKPADDAIPDADDGEVTALPDFSVSIEASTLTGNTPLTVDFSAKAEGVELERLTLRWIVDQVLAGSEPTLSYPFYRAGASTVVLQADLRNEAGDVKTAEATATLTLLGCADLQFDRVTLELPTDVPPGATLTIDVGRLRNEGDRIDGPFEVALALSVDELYDPEIDRLLPGVEVPSMTSGLASESAQELAGETFALPDDVVPGPYYVFAVADPGGVVNECQETNNARASTNSIVVDPEAGKLPDLAILDLAVPPETVVAQGENLSYSFKLSNTGEADAKQFRYAFWVSDDPVLDRETDRPIVLASEENSRVQNMPAGFELGFFKSWKVPEDLADGDYWVIGEVDATGVIAESDEGNNVAVTASPFRMRFDIPECYDLDLVDIQVTPLSTYWGGSVLMTATVANPGSQPTPDDWLLRAYLSLSQTLSPVNAILVGTFPLEGIPAGETRSYEILIPIGDDLPVIPHYLGVVIDPTEAFDECSESNNAGLFGEPIKINALAEVDIGVSDFVFHPDVVPAGTPIKVEYQLGNAGTTAATSFQVGVVLSSDAAITRADIEAGRDVVIDRLTVTALQPEEARAVIRDVTVPSGLDHAVPEWFIGVMVDLDGFLTSDRDASNNVAVSDERLVVTDATGGCFEDGFEDNDSLAQAVLVTPADGTLTALGSCGDDDWYLVDVSAGASLAVDVTARAILSVPETSADLIVEIRDPAGSVVAKATLGPDYRPRAWVVPAAGAYAVRVAPATTRNRAAYDLAVRFLPPVVGIDLVPFDVVAAPASAYAGGRLSVTWSEVNVGTQPAAAHIGRVWLSRDRELQDGPDGIDVMLAEVPVPAILPGDEVRVESVSGLAATLQPGTWYAIVVADADGAVAEVDESANQELGGPVVLDPLKVCHDDDLEPNDEARIATLLNEAGDSDVVSAAVVCPGLEDWYGIDLEVGESAEVSIQYAYELGKGRLLLELWSPDGQAGLVSDAKNGSARVSLPYAWRAGRWLFRVLNDTSVPSQGPYTYGLESEVAPGSLGLACTAERYEPNDALSGAGAIGCGKMTGELCNADVDWYVVPGRAGLPLRVDAAHPTGQMLVTLVPPAGTPTLATIYGTGNLTYTPTESGPLYIRIGPRPGFTQPMTSFHYTLTVTGILGADLMVLDMVSELDHVVRGEDVGIGFAVENQCTEAASRFTITAWLSLDEVVDAGDIPLLVLQQQGLDAGDSLGFRNKVTVPLSTQPGLYYLIAEADSGDAVTEGNEVDNTLSLPLQVDEPCVADRYEPNDVEAEATVVARGTQADLTVCPFDADWFAVSTSAGARVNVKALFSTEAGDLDLRVYNPLVSATIPVAVSTSTDDDEEVTVSTPLATTLYVRVSGYGGATAPYTLVVAY